MTVTLTLDQVLAILRDLALTPRGAIPPVQRDQLIRLCRRIAVDMEGDRHRHPDRWRSTYAPISLADDDGDGDGVPQTGRRTNGAARRETAP